MFKKLYSQVFKKLIESNKNSPNIKISLCTHTPVYVTDTWFITNGVVRKNHV